MGTVRHLWPARSSQNFPRAELRFSPSACSSAAPERRPCAASRPGGRHLLRVAWRGVEMWRRRGVQISWQLRVEELGAQRQDGQHGTFVDRAQMSCAGALDHGKTR